MNEETLSEFVEPYYSDKDEMHDLRHIRRVLAAAQSISRKYHVDREIITFAAYFHGIDRSRHKDELIKFMGSQGFPKEKAAKTLLVASESHKESEPKTIEGKILHDAHLVAGGKSLMVARFLVTGALRGFPVEHTIDYFEDEVDERFKCYLPETRRRYAEMERFARGFFQELKKNYLSKGS